MKINKPVRTTHTCVGCPQLKEYATGERACKRWREIRTPNFIELTEYPTRPDWCNEPRSEEERAWQVEAIRKRDARKSLRALAKRGVKTIGEAAKGGGE